MIQDSKQIVQGRTFIPVAGLLQRLVAWILKTLLACIIGINVVQGLLAPAIDSLKGSAYQTAKALPGIGNAIGGVTDVLLGTTVLIKNGIGMAGTVIAVGICVVPLLQMLVMAFMYKLAAALVQPVSDKRITGCIGSVSEGYELIVKVIFSTGILFLLTIPLCCNPFGIFTSIHPCNYNFAYTFDYNQLYIALKFFATIIWIICTKFPHYIYEKRPMKNDRSFLQAL